MKNMMHPYHLVDLSPWPLTSSLSALMLTTGLAKWFSTFNPNLFLLGVFGIILSMIQWWRDITREGSFQGLHTMKVVSGLQWGMILFITSEVLFFFSFFWAFFHSSLTPCLEVGSIWPPIGVEPLNPFQVPLLNTIILLSSGITVTWTHHSVLHNKFSQALESLFFTIILGLYFTRIQAMEYIEASFSIADSVYGATFFVATGFHGLHVIIGATFLLICWLRLKFFHFSSSHHFGFEAAAWYWHFVDVVWLFLYTFIYWWGSYLISMKKYYKFPTWSFSWIK
uniref:Cytochrome c oxidase subunit 3 n=1 Tax=Proasellus spelaeus TaxID=1282033 RepID=A0A485M9C0_9CRUS|nr:cytochrome c oxydase subunit 3 [Proasellus spelaeus]